MQIGATKVQESQVGVKLVSIPVAVCKLIGIEKGNTINWINKGGKVYIERNNN